MLREKKVYANYVELVRFTLKGIISFEVKHPCSCCTSHTITREVHNSGSCSKGDDMAAYYIEHFKQDWGNYYNEYTNIHWVGEPKFTTEPFMEEVPDELPCTCPKCKVTITTEGGKTEVEIEGVPV